MQFSYFSFFDLLTTKVVSKGGKRGIALDLAVRPISISIIGFILLSILNR